MPQLGETVSEGTVTVWHKKPGDTVKKDELLLEIATDKVEMEIPAPADGTVGALLVEPGTTVPVGTRLTVIDDGKGAPAPVPDASAESSTAVAAISTGQPSGGGTAKLSPVVRKLLAENNLKPEDVKGTGEGGRITRDDVLAAVGSKAQRQARAPTEDERVPFSHRRKAIAEHMVRSLATAAHVVQAIEVDFAAVEALRTSSKLSYLPYIARALCLAIRDYPKVNATIEGETLVVRKRINLSIAVDLDHEGLMTPVVKDADKLDVAALGRAIQDLAGKARAGKLMPDEMTEGTYTISNSGSYGTLFTASIINQPQVAILSTDGIRRRPVVIDTPNGEAIAIRPIGVLAQSFDHRAFDGAYSAAFLKKLKEILETGAF